MSAGIGSLAQAQALVNQVTSLIQQDTSMLTGKTPTNVFPVRTFGNPQRLRLAGQPEVEETFHTMMVPGMWLETNLGEAMGSLLKAQNDRQNSITHYMNLIRCSTTSKLPLYPRTAKVAIDVIHFMKQVQTYLTNIQQYIQVMQANLAYLNEMEKRMTNMVNQNEALLSALLNDICNWKLPSLPSMPLQLGRFLHWGGFIHNTLAGFELLILQLLNPGLNTNFTFSSCTVRTPDLSSLFSSTPNSATFISSPITQVGGYTVPLGGDSGDPSQYGDPTYIATMQNTSAIVIDPDSFTPIITGSLPPASSIISNYQLTPSQYADNVVSIVPALENAIANPALIQQLSQTYLTLQDVVNSGYDPNLTAAWIFYMQLNHTGRAGTWVAPFSTQYTTSITPSVVYLASANVPYNNVLGGTGVQDAPTAIPLISTLKAQTTDNLLWRLSYLEAALLGYTRCTAWDGAADTTYLTGVTNSSPDYVASTADLTVLSTQVLGTGTATYPVSCSYPTGITSNLNTVIAQAALDIEGNSTYQSTRPQNRYTYNMFAEAELIDRYSQFWRDFNTNLQTLLAADPYLVAFAIQNSVILNEATNPLASTQVDYTALSTDALSRNRKWLPGSVLLPVPAQLAVQPSSVQPDSNSNGWSGGTFDATTFLARPDVQAQSIPTQVAMLRLNQSYADLQTTAAAVSSVVSDMQATVQAASQSVASSGWEVDTAVNQAIPPSSSTFVSFEDVVFDQGGYVASSTEITIGTASVFALTGQVSWDPSGDNGVRTISLLQNGVVIESQTNDPSGSDPFDMSFTTIVSLNAGDTLQVEVSHQLSTSESIVSGSFMGLMDPSSTAADTAIPPDATINLGQSSSALTVSEGSVQAGTAVSIQSNGQTQAVNVQQTAATPILTVDGVILTAATAGEPVPIGSVYGTTYSLPNANFITGSPLYIGQGGVLTDVYPAVGDAHWIVVVGKAVSPTSFLFQPQLPYFRG